MARTRSTWPSGPAGGVIRVVLVDEPTGWRAFFCTDTSASVADILEMAADRFSLEITFRECKEIVGAGQQQVRFLWANIGAFHICLWTFTLTEAWSWSRKERSWCTARPRLGTALRVVQAMRTRDEPGDVNCWARRFGRFYVPGSPRRKFRPPPIGCSAWRRDIHGLPESAVSSDRTESRRDDRKVGVGQVVDLCYFSLAEEP